MKSERIQEYIDLKYTPAMDIVITITDFVNGFIEYQVDRTTHFSTVDDETKYHSTKHLLESSAWFREFWQYIP